MGNQMGDFQIKILSVMAPLSGCHATSPSPVSNSLEADVIPQLIEWSKAGGEFDLTNALPPGAHEWVCIVPDYNCLGSQKILGDIEEYHSAFGTCIPENSSALVVIGGGKAHAALVDGAALKFDVPGSGECVAASRAILRSNLEPHRRAQTADLFETE